MSDIIDAAVCHHFGFLKGSDSIKAAYLKGIDLPSGGLLLPFSTCHLADDDLLTTLADWRNVNVSAYPEQFVATLESTRRWAEVGLLESKGRILFLVLNNHGRIVGHLGFNNCTNNRSRFEIDNVVRGCNSNKGILSEAMQVICTWAKNSFPVDEIYLRVLESNSHAVKFYERLGFVCGQKTKLKKVKKGATTNLEPLPDESSDYEDKFVEMVLQEKVENGDSLILTAGPSISAIESSYAYDAAARGWNSRWSIYLTKFEEEFAEYVGAKHALATSSCTGALHIALMALDIGPGDEVIVPDQTWVATANAVRYAGATPIFADVELDTWNIDATKLEHLITEKTKAIMPVHMYGQPARMSEVMRVAKKFNLRVVEDAAPAIGAEWKGKRCGSFGDFAGFSFQGAKLLVTGEGGMLVMNDDALYERAKKIWDQGRNPNKTFWIDAEGVKYKMSNIQAAIGLGQLQRADELIEMKRRLFSWYEEGLSDVPHITLNKEVEHARSIYWMSSLFLDEAASIDRDELIAQLKLRNVDTRPVFPAISQYPIWPLKQEPQPNALRVGLRAMNLPSGVCLTKDQVMYVCRNIADLVK